MSLLIVGSLGKATGLRGELFVQAYNVDSPHWAPGTQLHVLPEGTVPSSDAGVIDDEPQFSTRLIRVRTGAKGRLVVKLDRVRSRTDAEKLRNCLVAIEMDVLEPPAADEFYYHEIIGWEVRDQDGTCVGNVVRAVETYTDLVEIKPLGGGENFYVPVVAELITTIDRSAGVLYVSLPEGLIP